MTAAAAPPDASSQGPAQGPLVGLKVVEFGSTIAGPFCARLLGDCGAEVIKVEPPEGDAVRGMGDRKDGIGLYAVSILRNKKLIALDLKAAGGVEVARDLCRRADIVIENFRPGTMERLGLGYDALAALNPGLVMVRISGFGQTGPYSPRPGYGVTAEAVGGIRHLTGDPDRPPARVAVALTDMATALYGAMAAMMAIYRRSITGRGQQIDAALYEAAFSFMEPHVPAHALTGVVPARMGSGLPNTAPNNLFPCGDGAFVHIAAFGDAVFRRFSTAIGRPDLPDDPRFDRLPLRAKNKEALNALIAEWTLARSGAEAEAILLAAEVPVSRIYTIADIFADPHYRAREMIVEVPHPTLGSVKMAAPVPKFSETPGAVRWPAAAIGAHSREILEGTLGYSPERIAALAASGAVRLGPPAAAPETAGATSAAKPGD